MTQSTVEINPEAELQLASIHQLLSANNEFEIKEIGSDIIISRQTNGKESEIKLQKPTTFKTILRDITQLVYMDGLRHGLETISGEMEILRKQKKECIVFANKFIPEKTKKKLLDNKKEFFTEKGIIVLEEILGK